jgi:hypothetical protein
MNLNEKSNDEILKIADAIMDNLMDASTAIDYERHIRDFTERAKGALSKERFEQICREYQAAKGYFGQREFVAMFRRPQSVAIVWKQSFTKTPGEYVAEMVLVQNGDRYLVDHVMVF